MFKYSLAFLLVLFTSVSVADMSMTYDAKKIIYDLRSSDFSNIRDSTGASFARLKPTTRSRKLDSLPGSSTVEFSYKMQLNKNYEFDGQCVSFVKAVSNSTNSTRTWRKSTRMSPSANVASGSIIATFSAPNGRYDSYAQYGGDHVGVLLGIRSNYIWVMDQNWIENDPYGTAGTLGLHKIYFTGRGGVTDAYSYYSIQGMNFKT